MKNLKLDLTKYSGLSAKQANNSLKRSGANSFDKDSHQHLLIKQLLSPFALLLVAAAVLSGLLKNYADCITIFCVVVLNTIFGTVQEFKSSDTVKKISKLIENKATVVRDGKTTEILANQLVPNDILILRAASVAPADAQILQGFNLSVSEIQLTGGFIPQQKCVGDLIYSGSTIESGECVCKVVSTGLDTRLGKIAALSKQTKEMSPYRKTLERFSMVLLKVIGVTAIIVLLFKVIFFKSISEFYQALIFCAALAVAVIPEALPIITTINMSYGAAMLAKHGVYTKRLSAIEDLGRINVLCTDKTGTLTHGCLSVKHIYSSDCDLFLRFAVACADKTLHPRVNAIDKAFLAYVEEQFASCDDLPKQIKILPFDENTMRRRTVVEYQNNLFLVSMGHPSHLNGCNKKFDTPVGSVGISYKKITDDDYNETNMTFLGYAELVDPIRKSAKSAVAKSKQLGVDVKIISGDSVESVYYAGTETGIYNGSPILTGADLDKIDDTELKTVLKKHSLFACLEPQHKYRIIKNLKTIHTVGFQGDGVNDAPSLKLCDVAVSLQCASDVAKECADIILLNDDLEAIVEGIKCGRQTLAKVNNYITHAMIGNLGSFFSLAAFYMFFSSTIPMLTAHLLIANLMQELPLMTTFSDNIETNCIKVPVTDIDKTVWNSLLLSVFTAIFYFGFYFVADNSTELFLFFNFSQLLIVLSIRVKGSMFGKYPPSKLLLFSILLFIFISFVLTCVPVLSSFAGFDLLSVKQVVRVVSAVVIYIVCLDAIKIVVNKRKSHR